MVLTSFLIEYISCHKFGAHILHGKNMFLLETFMPFFFLNIHINEA